MDIYRYMSFFELYNLVKHKQLKFSKLSLMDDINEGLAMAIDTKRSSFDKNKHMLKKNSIYISCWTKEKDSIAMWLFYSKNKDSIRVKTTQKKLEYFSNEYSESIYCSNPKELPCGEIFSPFETSTTNNVIYKSYEELIQKIKKGGWDSIILDSCLIKDNAYKFENEVRSSIRLQMRNEVSEEEVVAYQTDNELANILNVGASRGLTKESSDDVIHIEVDEYFIDEICFDQRTPQFQVDIYKEILGVSDGIIKSTNIFSSKII